MRTTEFYTVKRIDNSRLRRQVAPKRFQDYARVAALGGILAAGGLLYAWQHFQCIQLGYLREELKAERAQALELNQQLKLEAAALSAPMRIDAIARQLGLTVPVPGQVAPVPAPAGAVLARARYDAGQQPR
jgi:cell division protein FtsL